MLFGRCIWETVKDGNVGEFLSIEMSVLTRGSDTLRGYHTLPGSGSKAASNWTEPIAISDRKALSIKSGSSVETRLLRPRH